MSRRISPVSLLKILLVAGVGLLLVLWLASPGAGAGAWWLLAAWALAAALILGAGMLLRRLGRDRDLDLSASELTTLTFPPEGRLQRSHRR